MPDLFTNALPREKTRPHRWSTEERILLCVLQRFFDTGEGSGIAPHDLRDILVECFQESFDGPITPVAVRSQFNEMMCSNSTEYLKVFATDFTAAESQWAGARKRIRTAAKKCHILLRARTGDSQSLTKKLSTSTGRKRVRSDRFKDLGVLGPYGEPQDSDSDSSPPVPPPRTPKKARALNTGRTMPQTSHTAKPTLPSPPPTSPPGIAVEQADDNMPDQMPLPTPAAVTGSWTGCIGFRFFDKGSFTSSTPAGFRAGNYEDRVITPPPDFESDAFRSKAYTHLRPMPEPSNFISIFRNFRPALHRALVSYAEKKSKTAHVAFIDLEYLHRNKLGGRDRIFNAKTVIQRHGITGFCYKTSQEYAYSGQFEVLVWGKIEPEAIISCRPLADLRRFFADRPPLERLLSIRGLESAKNSSAYRRVLIASDARRNRETGTLIGEMLGFLGIKRPWVQSVADNIAYAWYFKKVPTGSLRSRLQGSDEYDDGVWDAFTQFEARELFSKLPGSLQVTFYPPPTTCVARNTPAAHPQIDTQLKRANAPVDDAKIKERAEPAVESPAGCPENPGEGSVIVVKEVPNDEAEGAPDNSSSRSSSVTLGRPSPPVAAAVSRHPTVSRLFQGQESQRRYSGEEDNFMADRTRINLHLGRFKYDGLEGAANTTPQR